MSAVPDDDLRERWQLHLATFISQEIENLGKTMGAKKAGSPKLLADVVELLVESTVACLKGSCTQAEAHALLDEVWSSLVVVRPPSA